MARLTKAQVTQAKKMAAEGATIAELEKAIPGCNAWYFRKQAEKNAREEGLPWPPAKKAKEEEAMSSDMEEPGETGQDEPEVQDPDDSKSELPSLSSTIEFDDRQDARIVPNADKSEWLIECCGYKFLTHKNTKGRAQRILTEYKRGTIDDLEPAETYEFQPIDQITAEDSEEPIGAGHGPDCTPETSENQEEPVLPPEDSYGPGEGVALDDVDRGDSDIKYVPEAPESCEDSEIPGVVESRNDTPESGNDKPVMKNETHAHENAEIKADRGKVSITGKGKLTEGQLFDSIRMLMKDSGFELETFNLEHTSRHDRIMIQAERSR